MTVRVVGMASGDTAESVRLALSLFQHPSESGVLNRRGGLVPYVGSADLTGPSPMVGRVSPFIAWVDGTSSANQGGYPVIVDANVDLTFDPGEAGNSRIDRVVLQIRDNPYDASGQQDARVLIVKGQSGGAANAVPASSELLWEVTVLAGASSGGTPINISTARADKRRWTSGNGGMLPVKDATDLATLTPYEGMQVYRIDGKAPMIYQNAGWRWSGPPTTVVKGSAQTIASSITMTNDTELFISGLVAGATYALTGNLVYAAHASADIKFGFTVPNNAALEWVIMSKAGTTQANGNQGLAAWDELTSVSQPRAGGYQNDNTSKMAAIIDGLLYAGDGGTLQLQWAQDTSNATGSIVTWPSRLTVRRLL